MPSDGGRPWIRVDEFPVDGRYPFEEYTVYGTRYIHFARGMFLPENPTPEEIEAVYAYWALDYDTHQPWTPDYGENAINLIAGLIGRVPEGRVVDLGTGTGMVMRGMVRAGVKPEQLTGIDNSEAMLTIARQKAQDGGPLADATLKRMNLAEESLLDSFERGSVDLVTASFSLHHLPEHRWPQILAEISDILAPGGHFVCIDSLRQRVSARFRDCVDQNMPGARTVPLEQIGRIRFQVGYQIYQKPPAS